MFPVGSVATRSTTAIRRGPPSATAPRRPATADVETVVTALRNGRSAMGGLHAPVKLKKSAKKIRDPRAASSINLIVAGSPKD